MGSEKPKCLAVSVTGVLFTKSWNIGEIESYLGNGTV